MRLDAALELLARRSVDVAACLDVIGRAIALAGLAPEDIARRCSVGGLKRCGKQGQIDGAIPDDGNDDVKRQPSGLLSLDRRRPRFVPGLERSDRLLARRDIGPAFGCLGSGQRSSAQNERGNEEQRMRQDTSPPIKTLGIQAV